MTMTNTPFWYTHPLGAPDRPLVGLPFVHSGGLAPSTRWPSPLRGGPIRGGFGPFPFRQPKNIKASRIQGLGAIDLSQLPLFMSLNVPYMA
jgi:hypothetical protein